MANQHQVRWPNLDASKAHPDVILAIKQLYNALDDHNQAFSAMSQKASLVATVNAGAVSGVDVVTAGQYSTVPSISAVGGGGSGATFRVKLNQSGGIRSVTVTNGGQGYTSPPALTVS